MVTVAPADQRRLLEVQALDIRLEQLAHTRATLPEAARAAELEALTRTLRDDLVLLRTKVSDLDRELARAENDVQAVRSRADRDRARLNSGQGSAKDLVGLQHEVESLARRQSVLEDAELEVMERREEQVGLLEATQTRVGAVEAELAGVTAARDARYAELDSARTALEDDRKAAATGLPEAMTKVYERLRDRLGSGAAQLAEGRCDGCRMPMAPSEVHALLQRPADEMLRCPECERILVRPESPGGVTAGRHAGTRHLVVEADGGSRGNPGPSGWGALVRDRDGTVLAEAGERCGLTTNNVAEYSGLLAGLRLASAIDPGAHVEVRMDSKLVVEQMSGRWKIKDRRLAGIAAQASRAHDPSMVRYTWVPRAQNGAADRLANDAMDGTERTVEDVLAMLAADPDPTSTDDTTDPVGAVDPAPDPVPSRAAGRAGTVGAAGTAEAVAAVPLGASQPDLGEATTVLLVRHGRTRLTQERRFSGVRGEDAPLTDVGRLDAVGAAAYLAGVHVDAVVTSPLRRAGQTAEQLGARLGWPRAAVDDRWAEVAFGDWDALTAGEVSARDPELFRRWLSDAGTRPPGGESMLDLEARVADGLADLLAQHRGGTVVVVCHMTPIRSVVRQLLGAGEQALWRLRFAPGSLTTTRHWPDGGAEVDGVGLHVPPDASTLF